MNLVFFQNLTEPEALAFLQRFLTVEHDNIKQHNDDIAFEAGTLDYTINSLGPFFDKVTKQLITFSSKPDSELPMWIRESSSYTDNLFEFDRTSKVLALKSAYYFGECFVRSFVNLEWSVGESGFVHEKMPVVRGFNKNMEMAPLMITENLFRRKVLNSNDNSFGVAIERWKGFSAAT